MENRKRWMSCLFSQVGHDEASRVTPQSVLGSLGAFEVRYDVPVVFCPSPDLAARQIERWAFYFARECVEAVNGIYRAAVVGAQADLTQLVPRA
jgi:hypothetical protein